MRGGGRGGARGGRYSGNSGRGRSSPFVKENSLVPWRHNAKGVNGPPPSDPDLMDTATSPGKGKDMEVDVVKHDLTNPAAKRNLDLGENEETKEAENNLVVEATKGGMPTLTDSQVTGDKHDGAMENDRKKRTKKDGANSSSLGSAGSLEGSVRSQ